MTNSIKDRPLARLLACAGGFVALAALAPLTGCTDDNKKPAVIAEGIFAPLGEPRPSATTAQLEDFTRGMEVATHRFSAEDGLGPQFNVTFCVSCHEKPVFGGGGPRYRNFNLVAQTLSDGSFTPTGKAGVQVHYDTAGGRVATDELTNLAATRNPIPFFGLGLLAEIPEEEILKRVDENDADGDGISGRANYDRGFVGRFGRKAQTVSLEGFIRGPLFNHLGITSNPLPQAMKERLPVPSPALERSDETTSGSLTTVHLAQAAAPEEPITDDDDAPDPELSDDELFALVSMTMLMAAPEPEPLEGIAEIGSVVFEDIGCASCHTPTLEAPRGLIPLYSDLLLHDMGDELGDGIEQGAATGNEFRTQPLWGVIAAGPYLHDGRADTLDEAIRLHGGEASAAQKRYVDLSSDDRAAVIEFLTSLGGRDQASAGLLAPDSAVPPAGELGGPAVALDATDADRFAAGRKLFDRDMGLSEGLGPVFNGDACRACHFEPRQGGAGPNGVNVVRQGIIENGEFVGPHDTITHRHMAAVDSRREPVEGANYFEQRQTPHVFGQGLIDRIPAATILAAEDPDDEDGDGISGRAHVLPDGRLGRFGWKAQVPSVAEFVRDAMTAELGATLPPQEGLTFGATTDDDDVPDPEASLEDIELLDFYISSLAPPKRIRTNETLEDEGEQHFINVGCASCHTPSMTNSDGVEVELYSDLLLHDVARFGALGIVDGDATMHEFRTAPLWGIAETAPYMHDGRAHSLEAAIDAHEGEAEASRQAVGNLTASEREALLAFLRSL